MQLFNSTNLNLRKTTMTLGIILALGSGTACATSFSSLDTDANGKISKDEYYGYAGDLGVYGDWDLNDDNLLDEDEWAEIDYDYNFVAWDTDDDGYLDDDELYEGTYDYYDLNDDYFWDEDEWDDAGDAGWLDV